MTEPHRDDDRAHPAAAPEAGGVFVTGPGAESGVGPDAGRGPVPHSASEGDGRGALLVGTGILLSRLSGLIRQAVLARYLGNSAAADALAAAMRIPNFLQNLFGEGVLSAAFIPVYARLRARHDDEEAARVASAIGTLLALVTATLVLLGVLAAPLLVDTLAPGFSGARRELTIRLIRIVFPGIGVLVLSAWCLGILNSHRRFLLSYATPVLWNLAIIAAAVAFGGRVGEASLVVAVAWGSLFGTILQLAAQLPTVTRLVRGLRPVFDVASVNVRTVLRNFVPVVIGRGVVQLSAFADTILASLLPAGAVAAVSLYAQQISMLPVSLFGMSVSAAELPAMASASGNAEEVAQQLRRRLNAGLRRIAFLVVPSAVAFLALGDVIVAALYQRGRFTRADSIYVWAILAGAAVGLLATTLGRLYASTFYALRDTRTPVRFALVRVVLGTALGLAAALWLPRVLGIDARWGAAGLTVASGAAGWVEFVLLRRSLGRRVGDTGLQAGFVARLWASAAGAAAVAWAAKLAVAQAAADPSVIGVRHPVLTALAVLVPYGVVYFVLTGALGLPESRAVLARVTARLARGRRGGAP